MAREMKIEKSNRRNRRNRSNRSKLKIFYIKLTRIMTSVMNLEDIKRRIEQLGINYQIEILSILVKGNVHINENKTGIRLNMGFLLENHRNVFEEIIQYLEYAEEKESRLDTVEMEKHEISTTYFN
jgi:hypothetical protein